MKRAGTLLATAFALGLPNLARVAAYRAGVRLGLNRAMHCVAASPPPGPFFRMPADPPLAIAPSMAWSPRALYFGHWPVVVGDKPPDWHANPLTGGRMPAPQRNWWEIPDFDPAVGDIKAIWEASRLDWAIAFAQQARCGSEPALHRLNAWLTDWCARNPGYKGANWKCGQETSIRVMHLAMAAMILGQARSTERCLLDAVALHLARIEPTVGYAKAQDNNHGTSEAAGLYIGGSWLEANGMPAGRRWKALGLRLLEGRVARLIGTDGSFSQYSTNYHRVLLDTLSMTETWRRHLGLPAMSSRFRQRAALASEWLRTMVDPGTGDVPITGANDGARLLPLTDTGYRDYRPSVQLAAALFQGRRAWAAQGSWDLPLAWLGIEDDLPVSPPAGSQAFDDGGFAVLRKGGAMALLRYPRFRFRPSQADALHVDLWKDGRNLLGDAGTFGYNAPAKDLAYFPGTAAHNTVAFDERDQMPRLGRFLFGRWLETIGFEFAQGRDGAAMAAAGYRDHAGATHRRRVRLTEDAVRVEDEIGGFRERAVLRWRLSTGEWKVCEGGVTDGRHTLSVSTSMPVHSLRVTEGMQSLHYLQKETVPVLEVEVRQPGTIVSEYVFAA